MQQETKLLDYSFVCPIECMYVCILIYIFVTLFLWIWIFVTLYTYVCMCTCKFLKQTFEIEAHKDVHMYIYIYKYICILQNFERVKIAKNFLEKQINLLVKLQALLNTCTHTLLITNVCTYVCIRVFPYKSKNNKLLVFQCKIISNKDSLKLVPGLSPL